MLDVTHTRQGLNQQHTRAGSWRPMQSETLISTLKSISCCFSSKTRDFPLYQPGHGTAPRRARLYKVLIRNSKENQRWRFQLLSAHLSAFATQDCAIASSKPEEFLAEIYIVQYWRAMPLSGTNALSQPGTASNTQLFHKMKHYCTTESTTVEGI